MYVCMCACVRACVYVTGCYWCLCVCLLYRVCVLLEVCLCVVYTVRMCLYQRCSQVICWKSKSSLKSLSSSPSQVSSLWHESKSSLKSLAIWRVGGSDVHKIHYKVDRPTGRPPDLPNLQPLLQSELKSPAERPGGLTSSYI